MNKGLYGISKNRTYDTKYHILVESSSYATTASYIDPLYISASAAASGFGSGGTFDTSSFVTNSQTSSFVTNDQTGSFILNSQTSSFKIIQSTGSTLYSTSPNAGEQFSTIDGIFLGNSAGTNASNAIKSNFLGFWAGTYATSASFSNFFGDLAGAYATNASYSLFVGRYTGLTAYNASYSTLIGYNVGRNGPIGNTNYGIGSNNIIIGKNITLPDRTTDSINIGAIIFATGSYSTISANSFSGSANGKVGINVVVPQYSLDVSGSGNFTNGLIVSGGITGSFSGSVVGYVSNDATSSFIKDTQTGSFALTTQGNTFSGKQYISETSNPTNFTDTNAALYTDGGLRVTKDAWISGSLYVNNLTVYGTQSIQNITSSQLNISTNLITVNTSTPTVRFGGLAVYDSGSNGKTGSLLWDSEKNTWIYANPTGEHPYDSAMVLMGPTNSGSIGNEVGINQWYAAVGGISHHMTSSVIWNSGSLIRLETNTQITGSLIVSNGITGSFSGSVVGYVPISATSSFVTTSQTSSFVTNSQTSSFVTTTQTSSMYVYSSSFATTASYIDPTFISASAAASGFGSGAGGVTSITAGTGISVNQTTGNVIITNTGGSGGISQGKVVAIVTGMANLF